MASKLQAFAIHCCIRIMIVLEASWVARSADTSLLKQILAAVKKMATQANRKPLKSRHSGGLHVRPPS